MLNPDQVSVHHVMQNIADWVYDKTNGAVQSGPFAGMRILRETSWPDTMLSPMLLGTWEQELHEDLAAEITRLNRLPDPKIVNVGCAEGYYAVGLGHCVPRAKVWAVDINEEALRLTMASAAANFVDNVIVKADLVEMFEAPDLVVMDCEGAEVEYLDLKQFPGLAHATVILEVHNLPGQDPCTSEIINDRFLDTHMLKNIFEGARNPNLFAILRNEPSDLRWLAVSEGRPCLMNWFVLRPR